MSPLGAAVLGGLLGLLIGFVVSALLHGPSRPPNKGAGAVAGTDILLRPCPQRHCCIGSPPGLIGETRAHDISPRPSPPPPGAKLGLRRVPLPARGHHPGRPL